MPADHGLVPSDPILSANIYCAGYLDDLIHKVIAPFESHFIAPIHDHQQFLWFVRYQRGGEHLKIRFHGEASLRDLVKAELDARIQRFLATLPPPAEESERDCHVNLFPIDEVDECITPYPDRTVLWTRYRRVPGTMGRQPLSDDMRHAALFYRCLGSGSTIVLRNLRPDASGHIPDSLRTSLALKFFISALSIVGRAVGEKLDYLRYHRDWLLASFDINSECACEHFDRKIDRRPGVLSDLRPLLDPMTGPYLESSCEAKLYKQWQDCSSELLLHVLSRVEGSEFRSDPYIKDQVLSTPFNLLHTHANQLALRVLDECYLCQLLSRACEAI